MSLTCAAPINVHCMRSLCCQKQRDKCIVEFHLPGWKAHDPGAAPQLESRVLTMLRHGVSRM